MSETLGADWLLGTLRRTFSSSSPPPYFSARKQSAAFWRWRRGRGREALSCGFRMQSTTG